MSAPDVDGDAIAARVRTVRTRIGDAARAAGRDPASVRLVAATKTQPVAAVRAVVAAGVVDVGENRAQELAAKAPELDDTAVIWHFIGRLQRNKVNRLAPLGGVVGVGGPAGAGRRARHGVRPARACSSRSTWRGRRRRVAVRPTPPPRWWSAPAPPGSIPSGS